MNRSDHSIYSFLLTLAESCADGPRVRPKSDRTAIPLGLLAVTLFVCVGCGSSQNERSESAPDHEFVERVTEKGPVKLVVRVSPPEMRLSDVAQLEVEVTSPPGVEVRPPEFGQAVGDFLVRDYSERKPPAIPGQSSDAVRRRFVYELEPTETGRHLVRSIALEFVDHRPTSEARDQIVLIESEPLEVQVTSELGDQVPDLADLDPMLPPRPLRKSSHWLWLVLAAIGLAVGMTFLWKRRMKARSIAASPSRSPEEIAHAALIALLAERLPDRGLVKEFYLRLTGIVRHFIEGTTGLRAPELTTEEFLRVMRTRDVFPAQRSARLQEFLEAADMVKYAGQQPTTDQIEVSIHRAHEFIDLNRPQAMAVVSQEGR